MKATWLFEAGLLLIIITAIHDLTIERTEGREQIKVQSKIRIQLVG